MKWLALVLLLVASPAGADVRGRRYIEQKAKEKLDAEHNQERFLE